MTYSFRKLPNLVVCLALLYFCFIGYANAEETNRAKCTDSDSILLEAYEPNRLGYTKDSDDVGFMDIKISTQYPIMYDYLSGKVHPWVSILPDFMNNGASTWVPYFAFTGRMGQYIGSRSSSPVISKTFNPKILFRHFLNGKDLCNKDESDTSYYDIEFAHLSNGQSIDSQASYDAQKAAITAQEQNSSQSDSFAQDFISRGWDYLGFSGKYAFNNTYGNEFRYSLKHYLNDGFLQGKVEEYFPWESARAINKLNKVSGIHLDLLLYKVRLFESKKTVSTSLRFDTGADQPFANKTWEAELQVGSLVFFYRTGFNSDLAQYYKEVSTLGFALNFVTNEK